MIDSVHSPAENWEARRRQLETMSSPPGNPVSAVIDPKEELRRMREDYEKMKCRFQNLIKKQDQLLRGNYISQFVAM
jgi:hypothetical protein